MKRRTITAIALLLAAILPLSAEALTYQDLHDAMSLNNTGILNAIEEYKSAGIDVKDAKSAYHPQLSYTLAGSYVLQHQSMDLDLSSIKGFISEQPYSLIIDPLNSVGTPAATAAVPLSIVAGRLPDTYTMPIDVSDFYLNAQVSLTQPIYTWGKITNNVRMYEEIEEALALQISQTEDQLDAQLKAYLASLYYLDELTEVLDSMQADADELVTLAEGSSSTGVLLAQDVASARLAASQIGLSRTQIATQKSTIIATLEAMTGLDLDDATIDFTPDEDLFSEIAASDRKILELQATGNSRTTMQMLTHMANAASYGETAAGRAALYGVPDIALSLSADYTAPLNSSFVDKSAWGVTVAVAMQGTIWDGGQRLNDKERAESAASSAQIAKTEASNTIKTTLAGQFSTMDLALANIEYQSANINLIQSELALEEAKLELGASSRQAVLQKRLELGQAEIEMITNRINLATSAYTIEYLTGFISAAK